MVPAIRLVTLLTALLIAVACTGPTSGASQRDALGWQKVELPGDLSAVALAPAGDDLLVGAYSKARPSARTLLLRGPTSMREVATTPHSPYAFEARWLAMAYHDGAVVAVGGARGGAHANVRWTTWSGDAAHLVEYDQTFETFGGWGAGELEGVAFAATEPVILGSWQSDRTGLDIAVWRERGHRWERQSSSGTPLGSTAEELMSARALTSTGAGLAASGSVTRLGKGSISTIPAVWLASSASGPWTRVLLPAGRSPGEAHAATCSVGDCLVVGQTAGRLALWELEGRSARTVSGLPSVPLPENAYGLAPVSVRGRTVVVAPVEGGSRVLVRSGSSWVQHDGPTGLPLAAAALGSDLWLVTQDADGTGTLWHAPL